MQVITALGTYQDPQSNARYDLLSDGVDAPTSLTLPKNAEMYIYLTSDLHLHFPNDDGLLAYLYRTYPSQGNRYRYQVSFTETGQSNTGISLTTDENGEYLISYTDPDPQPALWRGRLLIKITEVWLFAVHTVYTAEFSISIIALDKHLVEEGKLHVAEPVDIGNEAIFMSDPDNRTQYLLFASTADYNCVQSYSIFTGSEDRKSVV